MLADTRERVAASIPSLGIGHLPKGIDSNCPASIIFKMHQNRPRLDRIPRLHTDRFNHPVT